MREDKSSQGLGRPCCCHLHVWALRLLAQEASGTTSGVGGRGQELPPGQKPHLGPGRGHLWGKSQGASGGGGLPLGLGRLWDRGCWEGAAAQSCAVGTRARLSSSQESY